MEKNNQKKDNKLVITCLIIFAVFVICILPIICIASLSLTSLSEGVYSSGGFENPGFIDDENVQEIPLNKAGIKRNGTDKIAVVNISGAVVYSIPGIDETADSSSNGIIAQLEKAENDKSVKAIILRLNTPGGEVAAAEPICRTIKRISQNKEVYTFVDSEGASLGYLIANCTKYIYSRPSSLTGSIGVISLLIDYYGIIEKIGGKVEFVTNSAGSSKSGNSLFDKESAGYKSYQKALDETYEYFVNTVSEGRKRAGKDLSIEKIKEYSDGRILSGISAKEINFVDELMEYEDVIIDVAKKNNLNEYRVVEYIVYIDPLTKFLNSFGAIVNISSRKYKTSGLMLLMSSSINY